MTGDESHGPEKVLACRRVHVPDLREETREAEAETAARAGAEHERVSQMRIVYDGARAAGLERLRSECRLRVCDCIDEIALMR